MRRTCLALSIAVAAALAAWVVRPHAVRARASNLQRGVGLGLFASDPEWDYGGMIDEIATLGATDVEIAVAWDQGALASTEIAPRPGLSPSPETLRRTVAQAHAAGLRVLLFPIVHVRAVARGDWRGRIHFDGEAADAWWASYTRFVEALADVAAQQGVERFSVGSELLQWEADRARWAALIAGVRARYHGRVLYSANWDHFDGVSFWDLLDEAGVSAYFELTSSVAPGLDELVAAWRARLVGLAALAARVQRPLIITEIGYPSVRGANQRPWDETSGGAVDLEEQRLCYEAFCATAGRAEFLAGVYFWNWFGIGGANDAGYTPRGKPAALTLRRWLAESGARHKR
ncbi:MAG: hypothetical protein JWM53_6783 [bacterium]|nr:hypothetical protein [bacterium]